MPLRILSTCLFLLGCQAPPAPADDAALRVLFIGNSFTYANDLPAAFEAVALQAGLPRPRTAMVAFPNAALQDHLVEGTALATLARERWDFVVLQQGPSTLPESRDSLVAWTAQFAPPIRAAGAEPVLYMVWPGMDQPGPLAACRASYAAAAAAVQGHFAPVGEAWQLALAERQTLSVAAGDGFHPSTAGTYLASVVLLGTVAGVDPVTLPQSIPGMTNIPELTIRRLQEAGRTSLVGAGWRAGAALRHSRDP